MRIQFTFNSHSFVLTITFDSKAHHWLKFFSANLTQLLKYNNLMSYVHASRTQRKAYIAKFHLATYLQPIYLTFDQWLVRVNPTIPLKHHNNIVLFSISPITLSIFPTYPFFLLRSRTMTMMMPIFPIYLISGRSIQLVACSSSFFNFLRKRKL